MILTAESEGQEFDVDLELVSGWDALSFRQAMGYDLEVYLTRTLANLPVVLAADITIVKWLWARQTLSQTVTLAEAGSTVRAVPSPAGSDAEDGTDERQGEEQGDDQRVDTDLI